MASLYIHFPWCLAKCPYCDFVSYASAREDIDHAGYADAILREAEARAGFLERARPEALRISTIFFGGGTPSLWAPDELGRVLASLRALYQVDGDAEVTVECNPTSLDLERAQALTRVGVNRLSIGTQSLRQEQLRFLGRLHDPEGAQRAVKAALQTRARVSTDLIFGLPDQSVEDAVQQAEALADLGLRHLSCYQLTIEPGTQFGERRKRGLLPMADDGAVAEAFLAIDEALERRGLQHYEISNYAVASEQARHNLAYWHGDEYVGLGCGAFGFVRNHDGGRRYRNALLPTDYMARSRRARSDGMGEGDGIAIHHEELSKDMLLRERMMLGLRLAQGLDLTRAGHDLGIDPWTLERTRTVEMLAKNGRLIREGDILRIPRKAWLFADDIAARLF